MFCVLEAIGNTKETEDKIPPMQLIQCLKYLEVLWGGGSTHLKLVTVLRPGAGGSLLGGILVLLLLYPKALGRGNSREGAIPGKGQVVTESPWVGGGGREELGFSVDWDVSRS